MERSEHEQRVKMLARKLRRAYDKHKGEWLDTETAYEYFRRAQNLEPNGGQDIGEWRSLRIELQERYGLLELEAFNILRGLNIREYVGKYERMRDMMPLKGELESIYGDLDLLERWLRHPRLFKDK